jgi:hypothetical protein
MAEKGWTARVSTAAGAAAGTGAAQLGLGYGLGVVVWPVTATPDDSIWLGSLGWATWITASATVFGAVLAARLGGDPAPRLHASWRLALATSAAVGALVAVVLIALPARSAVRTDHFAPQVIAGGYALLGVVLGLVVAYWAVVCRSVAANLLATGVWLWTLAIAAIAVDLTLHRPSATYLTSWQFAELAHGGRFGAIFWPSALLTVTAAFLLGVVAAAPAARRGHLTLGTAVSGMVGPLLVAAAFLALAPQLTGALGPLESAYLIAPYAVLAGLAGSALTVASGRASADRGAGRTTNPLDPAAAVTADVDDRRLAGTSAGQASPADRASIPAQADRGTRPGFLRARLTGRKGQATRPSEAERADDLGRASEPGQTDPGAAEAPTGLGEPGPTPETNRPGQRGQVSGAGAAREPGQPRQRDQMAEPGSTRQGSGAGETGRRSGSDVAAVPAADIIGPAKTVPPKPKPSPSTGRAKLPAPPSPSDKSDKNDTGRLAAPAAAKPDEADPEIAAAARPARERKKVAPARKAAPSQSRSTVTPPPADPTIAQINPKPPPAKSGDPLS